MEKLDDNKIKHDGTTHGRVHAGVSGFRALVARKKAGSKLIRNSFVIPHETLPSTVSGYPAYKPRPLT